MAGITHVAAINVGGRLAAGNHAIVTACTTADDMPMIDRTGGYRYPLHRTRLVAGVTGIGGVDVRRGFTRSDNAIVATGTYANNLGVIHGVRRQWRPGCRRNAVTSIALISGVDMIGGFTGRNRIIMAADAGTDHL